MKTWMHSKEFNLVVWDKFSKFSGNSAKYEKEPISE